MLTKNKNTISDFVLARVSVNHISILEKFIFNKSKKVLDRIHILEKDIEEMKESVMDTIYAVVPKINDKKLSGNLIRLRRRLFNHKSINLDSTKIIIESIPEDETEVKKILELWVEKEEGLRGELVNLQKLYQEEAVKNEEQIWEIFHDDESEFIRGMPIVNSTFSSFLKSRKRKHYQLDSNFHKSVYSYFLRSVAKISPISTFTQLTLSGFEHKEMNFNVKGVNIRWLRGLVSDFFETLVIKKDFVNLFHFKVTDYIEKQNSSRIYIRGNYTAITEVFSKTEDVFSYNQYLDIIKTLPTHAFSYEYLVTQIDHPHPEIIATFLIEQKLIRPIMPCSLQDKAPFKEIADFIKKSGHFDNGLHEHVYEKLVQLDGLRESLEGTKTKSGRDTIIQSMKHHVKLLYQSLQSTVPEWLNKHELVYEDTRFKTNVPHLGESLKSDLTQLKHFIQPFMYRHALYDQLLNRFEKLYGLDGQVKVLEFLSKVIESETEYSDLIKTALNDDIQNVIKQENIYKENAGGKSATVYYQIVSESHTELLKGNYLIVINKVTDGNGSIFSRFSPLFDTPFYKEKIASWIHQLNNEIPSYEFSVGGDWANVQEKYEILSEQLNWVGELPNVNDEKNTTLGVIDLNISIKEDKFVLTDKENREIKPVYLGSVPEHLSVDLSKLFFTIIKPWYTRTPYGSNPLNKPKVTGNITHFPRNQKGKIVFEREKWVVKIEEIQEMFEQYNKDELFLELNKWRRKHFIPEEVFFTMESDSIMGSKPMWFHFLSISSINLLKRSVTTKYKYIILTEALPSTNTHWFEHNGEKHVTEYMSLLSI